MAAGETTTPILRSGPSNNNESAPYHDNGSYYGAAYGQAARAYVQAAAAAPPYPTYPSQNGGGPDQSMQQINLASPPAPPLAADFKNADFF